VADLKPDGLFMTDGPARRLIYTTHRTPPEQVAHLENAGAQVFFMGERRVDISGVLESLYNLGYRNVLVEGGGTIIAEFFRLGTVDRLTVYIAPRVFGGASAPTLADGPGFLPEQSLALRLESVEKFDETGGVLVQYIVENLG
jgi:riboflavin-specific deaminase-like protein